jgi:alkylation response protein AidB-like acyl-CoA dehydrogenase
MSQTIMAEPQTNSEIPEVAAARSLFGAITKHTEDIERNKVVPTGLIDQLNQAGLFNASLPRIMGGTERHPVDLLRIIEQLSYADSGVGWCAMIYLTTSATVGNLAPEWAKEIYSVGDKTPLTGGATAPTGRGRKVDGGIEVTGRWAWGSGTHHCDWICGGTLIEDGDDILRFPSGDPQVHIMYFKRHEVHLHDNWDPSGLRGTGSVDFEVKNVVVPDGRYTVLGHGKRYLDDLLYQVPFFGLFASAVASAPLGIARRAVDDFAELSKKKVPTWKTKTINESSMVQTDLARAEALSQAAHRNLFGAMQEVCDKIERGEPLTLDDRRELRMAATQSTLMCAEAVDIVYNAGGGTSLQGNCSLQRHFRDIHAATQHRMVSLQAFQMAGAVRLMGDVPGVAAL